jgi:hypothetical protein
MRQASVRWGLILGAAATGLGIVSLLIGLALTSFQKPGMDPTQLVIVILIRAVVRLLFLGMAGGLAYYAGYRVERDRVAAEASAGQNPERNRMEAVLTGGLVLALDWALQTAFIYLTGMSGPQPNIFSFLGSQAILGVICVFFGAGLGGLGARDEAMRGVLRRLAIAPTPVSVPLASASAAAAGSPSATDGRTSAPATSAERNPNQSDGQSEAAPAE